MKTDKINMSIYVIALLVILIIIQHAIRIFEMQESMISIIINLSAWITYVLFITQLGNNLKIYFKINNIRPQIILLSISYSVLLIISQIIIVAKGLIPNHDLKNISIIALFSSLILVIFSSIILIIQYIKFGKKLSQKSNLFEVRQLGYSLYFIPVLFITLIIFEILKTLKPFQHVLIIIELLPYWFTYKIYRRILNSKNKNDDLDFQLIE